MEPVSSPGKGRIADDFTSGACALATLGCNAQLFAQCRKIIATAGHSLVNISFADTFAETDIHGSASRNNMDEMENNTNDNDLQ